MKAENFSKTEENL